MYSMTGYGKATVNLPLGTLQIEIKTVNHRFKDFNLRLPSQLSALEFPARKLLAEHIARGRVDLYVSSESGAPLLLKPKLNPEMLDYYLEIIREINQITGVTQPPAAEALLKFKDIISYEESIAAEIWPHFEAGLKEALAELKKSRLTEGKNIENDFISRLDLMSRYLEEIGDSAPNFVQVYRDRLSQRMKVLLEGAEADEARLLQEAAFLADRSDITEEIVRLKSHISDFRKAITIDEPVGKRLEFITQELMREVNTIASKATENSIIRLAVELKTEIEKLREQVHNLE